MWNTSELEEVAEKFAEIIISKITGRFKALD